MTKSAWTDDCIARLKALWREGRSAAQIAGELKTGITRSAVLGKVRRLGLPAYRPAKTSLSRDGARRSRLETERTATAAPAVVGAASGSAERSCDGSTGGLTILTGQRGQCRWPLGDPAQASVLLCGRPVARGAFCVGHATVGYRTPPEDTLSLLRLADLA